MIKITVKVLAPLKKPFSGDSGIIEIQEGSSILDLLKLLNYSERHISAIMCLVNGNVRQHDHVLTGEESVELFILMGGG